MQIEINEKNEIKFYALSGKLNNGIEIDETNVPAGFTDGMFQPGQYLYTDGTVTVNPDYTAPVLTEKPAPTVSSEMLAINALGMQVAQIQAKLTTTDGGAS